jgi:tetraacyldisaccharide 4'-kinase
MGYRVAVISRGYKGKKEHDGGLVGINKTLFMKPESAGDEPYLIALNCPRAAVLIGKNRFKAGISAVRRFSTQVLILDDGFQHLAVKRDMNIVLLDASAPIGNGRIFPAGPLREPVQGLSRADAFVFTRCGNSNASVPKSIAPFLRNKPVFYCDHVPGRLISFDISGKERSFEPDHLKDHSLLAFSGIARNEDFFNMLKSMSYRIAAFKAYPDHHRYSSRDLESLRLMAEKADAKAMITSEKDYVKLYDRLSDGLPLYALKIKISFGEFETEFKNLLKEIMKN